jgi:hypothetical protein
MLDCYYQIKLKVFLRSTKWFPAGRSLNCGLWRVKIWDINVSEAMTKRELLKFAASAFKLIHGLDARNAFDFCTRDWWP